MDVRAGFPALMTALAGPVYSVALRMCGPEDAEDVTQEAFIKTFRALWDCPPERLRALNLRPWVLTIALNEARNHLRTASRRPRRSNHPGPPDRADASPVPDAALEHAEVRAELAAALLRLPVAAREAVVLRHVVGCGVAEVAAILERPVGTVKAQVSRGLAALRVDLENGGMSPQGG